MTYYIIRRLLQSILVLFIVMLITFILPYWQTEGILTPAYAVLGTHTSAETLKVWAAANGMNHPFLYRFGAYLDQVFLHFNLGNSYKQNNSVWGIIALYVPRTIWLAVASIFFTMLIAIPLGILQASRRNSVTDYTATGVAFVLYATPLFLFCLLAIKIFTFTLHWLPASPPNGVAPWAIFTSPRGFVMPVLVLTLASVAGLSRFMRGTVLEVLVQDYMRTARAKGCSSRRALWRHAFRNALGPIITLLGLSIPGLIGGALIVESVFNYEGLGIQTVNAAVTGDVPLVLGITLLVALLTLLGNLFADVMLGVINPRIRIEGNR